jgi:restriction system protein
MTIVEAIKTVLRNSNKPLTHKEIYEKIIENDLYSFKAKKPLSVVNSEIRRYCYGLNFPSASKNKFFNVIIQNRGHSKYKLYNEQIDVLNNAITVQNDKDKLPEELIYESLMKHKEEIKQELLENILNSPPSFFEELVIELLLKMGYGWDEKKSGYVNGKVGDGGIDGIINEDKLGLGKIYIQVKRYTDKIIGRPDLQQFVGAMENNRKGVYITTSNFSKQAQRYIEKQSKDIVLINGEKLTDLLIDNNIGIQIVQTFSTYKIDKDYFE